MRRGLHLSCLPALLLLLLAASCARPVSPETRRAYADLIVPPDQCRAPAPDAVAPEALARDVDVLERVLRRGYAGFELAGDDARWRRAFAGLRAAPPAEPVAPLAFRDLVLEHVGFVDDGHVGLWVFDPRRRWRATTGHQQAYAAVEARFARTEAGYADARGRRVSQCDGARPDDVLRPVPGEALPALDYVPIVLSREPRESIECAFEGGETERFALSRVGIFDRRGPAFERVEAPFPWLRLRTLFPDRASELERFVASAEELRDAPVIVLDLRRGGGGSDRYLVEWFRRLTSRPIRYWRTDALASEVTLQGALTFWGCVRAAGGGDEGGRAWLDARVARAERELEQAMHERGLFRERSREALEVEGLAPAPYRGRLVLVVDRGCNSACETSVMLARQLPGTIVAGENTEGTMKVGELRWYRLPESRVWISLGMRAHTDPFGGFREGRGYLPDLWLAGGDPDAQIRALAECAADARCAEALARGAHSGERRR